MNSPDHIKESRREAEPAIHLINLCKNYKKPSNLLQALVGRGGTVNALKDISLQIPPGVSFGIIGKNGSGKTTLLKIMATLIHANHGTMRIFGLDPVTDEKKIKSFTGYVPSDERSFFWRLTCQENLIFFGALYGLPRGQLQERIDFFSSELNMKSILRERFDTVSSGKKQLLSFARGMLIDPSLLIVDEPTRSLDLETAIKVRHYLKQQVTEKKRTLIVASHHLEDIDILCDQVGVLQDGQLITTLTRKGGTSLSSQIMRYFKPEPGREQP
ncbi:ABC transporter ATP-binding protein [candidate division CSSED10-310 bacterium]|uniref:ABC transporter ATP-binding protein n=1 Tax=candidate division CSSED10-310 bacterium TaxID=2855610 RepID=A0ABV6YTN9_UNCC1